VTIACLIVSVIGMMFVNDFGPIAYVLPGLCSFVILAMKVVNWKEFRESLFSPVILMMTCVIPVANALNDSGFTALVGNSVAQAASGLPVFLLVLAFVFLTSACATLTGANFGSAFVFVPIVISTCMALGIDPAGPAAATTMAAWAGGFLPIDGLPAMIMGMGNYTMKEYWKFEIPNYIIGCFALAIAAVLCF
jgi:di/tricarboxylate transporter